MAVAATLVAARVLRSLFVTLAVATALVALGVCGGFGADKAGGGLDGDSFALRLFSEDDFAFTAALEFADVVERLSGGTLRVDFVQVGRGDEIDAERGVVEDVRTGKAKRLCAFVCVTGSV